MRDMYAFIVGGGLAVLGGAQLGFLTIVRWGICIFGPGGTVIRILLLLAMTTWGLSDTHVLPYSCWCTGTSPDCRCGGASMYCSSSGGYSVFVVVASG